MVKIIVGNVYSKIVGFLPEDIQKELDKTLSYKLQGARFIPSVKSKQWDGVVRLYYRFKGQSFYTGLLAMVRELFKKHNIPFELVNDRPKPDINYPELDFVPSKDFENRDYQDFTIDRALKFTRGVLSVCTGGGKTLIVTRLISKIKTYPFIFYVLTKDLMEQAHGVMTKCLNQSIGKIGDGEVDIKKISVCTIQTAILALNMGNSKFKISDYSFDDEDSWDEKGIENAEKAAKIRKLIQMAKGVYVDECLSGDTKVNTEKGIFKIKDVQKNKCRFVQTCDGINIIYRPIVRWWDNGIKGTLNIKLSNGDHIQCTENHLLFTKRGWIKAKNLNSKDHLFCANVDVVKKLPSQINIDRKNLSSDIKLKLEPKTNGKKFIKNILQDCHSVNVDAKTRFFLDIKHLKNLYKDKGVKQEFPNISKGMINNQYFPSTILLQVSKKSKQLLEHAWGIHVSDYLMEDQKILNYIRRMGYVKKNGQNIRLNFYEDMTLNSKQLKTWAMENFRCGHGLHACQLLPLLHQNYIKMGKKKFDMKFSTLLAKSGLHGGYVTTDQTVLDVFRCIQRDGLIQKTELYGNGLMNGNFTAKYNNVIKKIKNIIVFDLIQKDQNVYQNILENMSQNSWNTNWTTIKNISKGKKQRVYDIEVKDTHCFFANNTLVHNCHHASARTVKDVLLASPNAYWKYGGSATPQREGGDDIMIQAMFGSKIVDINASYLIKKNWLVKPYIFFEPIENKTEFHSYHKIYETCVVKNDRFNDHVADTAKHLISRGLSVLILVKQYPQGNYLKASIPNSEFITGKVSTEKRTEIIDNLRKRRIMCMIATSLADEGLDIPSLDAVLIAGGGKSSTRLFQRIGRTLRKDKDGTKNKSIVVIYEHDSKYLFRHVQKVRTLLKREPEFVVRNSKGVNFICGEIDEVLGFESKQSDLFT